jgi:cell division protein FtsA
MVDSKRDCAVLNIGTNTVCAAIAKREAQTQDSIMIAGEWIRILGVGYQQANGIKRGTITDLDELEDAISGAIFTAEKEAKKTIKTIQISLPTWALKTHCVNTSINIGRMPIDEIHIKELANFDSSQEIDCTSEIIQIFPISYSVDEINDIKDPLDMIGNKLSAEYHLITAQSSFLKNISRCLNKNNIEVSGYVSSTYTATLAVALDNEISSGVTIVDIGGSTTSIACLYEKELLYLGMLPIGGQNITNDIATVLRTSKINAERLKIIYGVSTESTFEEEPILVSRIDDYGEEGLQTISRRTLDSIISARLDELFEHVQNYIIDNGADKSLYQKIIIIGGGSRLSGLHEVIKAKKYFNESLVRLGKPIGTAGSHDFVKTASFAGAAGTAMYCLSNKHNNRFIGGEKSLWQKITTWVKRGV